MADEPFKTLGERLAEMAQRLTMRRIPRFPWLKPLGEMLDHVAALPLPTSSRYARIEGPVSPIELTDRREPALARAEASPTAPMPWPAPDLPTAGPAPSPQPIPPAVRAHLETVVGPGAEEARVHTDEVADRIARAERADAVTVGRDIYFRQDAYRPDQDRGFGLLTHEVVHVLRALDPHASWRRATARGVADEEAAAEAGEVAVLGHGPHGAMPPAVRPAGPTPPLAVPSLPPPSRPLAPAPAPSGAPPVGPAQRPLLAASDRALETPSAEPGQASAMPNIDELKRSIYRDLMRQIKSDFERGG